MTNLELRNKIWNLYYRGFSVYEISKELNVTEAFVISVLRPNGY